MICRDTSTHGWVCGWLAGSMGGSGQITKSLINLDLIEIIQFCLKIYDLGGCMIDWVDGWFSRSMGGIRSYY